MQINNDWKTVSHTLIFQSAANFSECLKKAQNSQNLIDVLFNYNSQSLLARYKIRLIVHEENLDNSAIKTSRTKLTAQERHVMEEIKRMENSRNSKLIVGCEVLYGMDFVFASPSTVEKNDCASQVRHTQLVNVEL